MAAPAGRIRFIDGLRGLAILMVVLFHAYVRWPQSYTYGTQFAHNPLLNTSTTGVDLFFIISGFVILMTLEGCSGFGVFIFKRWMRLFPAMLAASLVIAITAAVLPERPEGTIGFFDLFPGLTFGGDDVFHFFGGEGSPHSIEGTFWSLYVEVRFYIVFGLAYYMFGRGGALLALLIVFSLCAFERVTGSFWLIGHGMVFLTPAASAFDALHLDEVVDFLRASKYAWFLAGSLYYIYWSCGSNSAYFSALALTLAASALIDTSQHNIRALLNAHLFVSLAFAFAVRFKFVERLFNSRVLLFLGYVSYPLYLLHQNMMVAFISKVGRYGAIPSLLVPVVPIAVVISIAWLFARYIEPMSKRIIATVLNYCGLKMSRPYLPAEQKA
jgi:peptidoglycan/LPS O-acetylase OafA/YrhL